MKKDKLNHHNSFDTRFYPAYPVSGGEKNLFAAQMRPVCHYATKIRTEYPSQQLLQSNGGTIHGKPIKKKEQEKKAEG